MLGSASPTVGLQLPDPPHVLYGDLFVKVQMAQVYPDSKDFCDALPKAPPAQILSRYTAARPGTLAALRSFVEANFIPPAGMTPPALAPSTAVSVPLAAHIDALWNTLTRKGSAAVPYSSLLPLPEPFVVPGGRFREIYYWDSYFTMLGLLSSGRLDLTQDMVSDFAHLIDTYGLIPNGNRTYYLTRSQPPFFFAMVGLLSPEHPERAWARYLKELKAEHAFWMDGEAHLAPGSAQRRVVALAPGVVLNRYWDNSDLPRDESYREDVTLAAGTQRPRGEFLRDVRAAAESGWDFSSRWLTDGHSLARIDTTTIVPVDLNSLLFGLERAIAAGCRESGDGGCAQEFKQRAAARRAAINRYLWDRSRGVYLDYSWPTERRVPHLSAATLYPLFTGAATHEQATGVSRAARRELLKDGGVVTTTLTTGQQWDAPNGWAPLQWVAISGFRDYGQGALAETIACRWMVNVARVYRENGKLLEKYDVMNPGRPGGGGEYPLQDGFGWTNGVTRRLIALYPRDAAFERVAQCPGEGGAPQAAHAAH